jgi:hypothetical protein
LPHINLSLVGDSSTDSRILSLRYHAMQKHNALIA